MQRQAIEQILLHCSDAQDTADVVPSAGRCSIPRRDNCEPDRTETNSSAPGMTSGSRHLGQAPEQAIIAKVQDLQGAPARRHFLGASAGSPDGGSLADGVA